VEEKGVVMQEGEGNNGGGGRFIGKSSLERIMVKDLPNLFFFFFF